MKFFVGSTNPVKLQAAQLAAKQKWPQLDVLGYDVASDVSAQPRTDEETHRGAKNRAMAALKQGISHFPQEKLYLGIGMEGGVFITSEGEMWSTVWACVIDTENRVYEANGGRIRVPKPIADLIINGGEMGPAISQLIGEENIKQKQGMFGVITNNFVTRTDEYASILQMAIGQWYGKDWDVNLRNS